MNKTKIMERSQQRENISNEKGNSDLQESQIEIKVKASSFSLIMAFSAEFKQFTIDWGDGIVEKKTPYFNEDKEYLEHTYLNNDVKTIKLDVKGLIEFEFVYDNTDADDCELQFGDCPELKIISCMGRGLKFLNISKCSALSELNCYNNKLTSLDISKFTDLSRLTCKCNKLTSLDVSNCTALTELDCSYNQLSALDVSNCIDIIELKCENNQLSTTALNALFDILPVKKSSEDAIINYKYNPGDKTCDKTILKGKGWIDFNNSPFLYFQKMDEVEMIRCSDCGHQESITYSTEYQCQSCGQFNTLYNIEPPYTTCACGGKLSKHKALFCPQCKSMNVVYQMEFIP